MTASGLEWLLEEVQAVIRYAIDGQAERVIESLERIGNEGGEAAMFSACFAWATAVGHMSGMVEAAREADGVAVVPLDGQPIDDRSPGTFAARFLACALNGDTGMAHALFAASLTDVAYHRSCVIALISMMAQIGRIKQADGKASGES